MIHLTSVSKHYQDHVALDNVNMHMDKGEMAFLTGHSGAGKSTLLKLILLLESATQGQIVVNERNVSRLKKRHVPYYRRNLGVILQNPQLLPDRNIFENVALPLIISGYHGTEIRRRVNAALDKVGLLNKANNLPSALSTGEQQRIGIARAVVNRPRLLVADEPTGNLDPELSLEIIKLFEAFNHVGVTVLIATHDLALIAPLNHRIITLKQGKLFGGDAA